MFPSDYCKKIPQLIVQDFDDTEKSKIVDPNIRREVVAELNKLSILTTRVF